MVANEITICWISTICIHNWHYIIIFVVFLCMQAKLLFTFATNYLKFVDLNSFTFSNEFLNLYIIRLPQYWFHWLHLYWSMEIKLNLLKIARLYIPLTAMMHVSAFKYGKEEFDPGTSAVNFFYTFWFAKQTKKKFQHCWKIMRVTHDCFFFPFLLSILCI